MSSFLFYLFAALTLGSALSVVFNRNTVNAAIALLLCLVGVSGLFATLDALLLAVLLILVYAGAVVALFLFIVMLLNPGDSGSRPRGKLSVFSGVIAAALLVLGLVSLATRSQIAAAPAGAPALSAGLKDYGAQLFTTYLLPVQIVGFLLLVAMLGVIVLSKKFETQEPAQ